MSTQENSTTLRLVDLIGQVVIPIGLLTGIVYYFGYVRQQALYSYFGVDLAILDLTTTDYIVRSTGSVFSLIALILVFGVVALAVHHVLLSVLRDRHSRWWRGVWVANGIVAIVLLALGAFGLFFPHHIVGPSVAAVALGLGALLLEYCAWMIRTDRELPDVLAAVIDGAKWPRRALVTGLAIVSAFWFTADIAHRNGVETARAIEISLPIRAEAVVLSGERLEIFGPGIALEQLGGSDSAFSFRYTGLRVLAHTGERWLLLPAGWTSTNDATIYLLPDYADNIRVDLRP
jgi:hypothetical protein